MDDITLRNRQGMTAKLIPRGATLTHWLVPDQSGKLDDIVLGFDDPTDYATSANQHFGCTTGRVANRTAGGHFTLDGQEYSLAINNGPNHLHGGPNEALDKVEWDFELTESQFGSGVQFTYASPDGQEGYPGNVDLKVTYSLSNEGALRIEYEATTDQATPLNLTNHTYFNLSGAGAGSIADHLLTIYADHYTPTDDTQIPTGVIAEVAGTPLDFRTPHPLGQRMVELIDSPTGGYDHNFVICGWDGTLKLAAEVSDLQSGRKLRVETTEPGVQLYTGNGLSGQRGKQGKNYESRSAFCLETQHFPNAINEPRFPSIVLRPGETYRHVCVYQASV